MGVIFVGLIGIALILGWSYYCATYSEPKHFKSLEEEVEYRRKHLTVGSTWWTPLLVNDNLPDSHFIEKGEADKICEIVQIKGDKVLVKTFGLLSSYEEEYDIEKFIRSWVYLSKN